MNKITRTVIAAAVAGAAVFSMSACTASNDEQRIINPIPEPKAIDLNSYSGETVDVTAGGSVVINVNVGTQADWDGKSSDEKVATFIKGIYTDNVVATPGIVAVGAGKATITLENTVTGDEKTIKVEVKAASK